MPGTWANAVKVIKAQLSSANSAVLMMRREMGDRSGEADALGDLAFVAEKRGDFREVQHLRQSQLIIRQELGDHVGVATATYDLGLAAMCLGDYPGAITSYSEVIPVFRRLADPLKLAVAMSDLTAAEFLSGAPDAVRHAEESLALWRALDDRAATAYALVNLGRALQLAGRHDEAVLPFLEGLAECRELGDVSEESLALYGLGLIELAKGDLDSAQQTLAESLRLVHTTGEPWHIAERLEALAGLWVARDQAERAARLLGAAAALREKGGFPLPPAEQGG